MYQINPEPNPHDYYRQEWVSVEFCFWIKYLNINEIGIVLDERAEGLAEASRMGSGRRVLR